ncbi:MAG: ergothioneine biosynthesis protein EgtB [Rhodospirillaceae bacterium]|jgi:gamma-glutamyl hercynylcysteine S-oxide synthase|nr:ergothioneine biosynthesis protein EgtB [Rhodospirillaceae bacterium]MBT7267965.1 ergothioneine biosynthesis protein EgtB [Rhodospirillaceae bacterium]
MTELVSTQYLADLLEDANSRTLELVDGLDAEQIMGPQLPIVNPLLWEIGHVAWFYEQFILRMLYGADKTLDNGDEMYDSIAIEHSIRWDLPLLPLKETQNYIDDIRSRMIDRLGEISDSNLADEQDSFIYPFATFHEDMHTEAYTYTRNTLEYPMPNFAAAKELDKSKLETGPHTGDVKIPGGTFLLGSTPDDPFLFDNEKWAHDVTVHPFQIARAAVTNEDFAAFVADDGYKRRDLWHDIGWGWRARAEAEHPVYWIPDGPEKWLMRHYDQTIELPPHQPLIHVNWYEASAYCNWAKRRLPSEIEWEVAATTEPVNGGKEFSKTKRPYPWGHDKETVARANLDGRGLGTVDVAAFAEGDSAWGLRQMLGNTWEWTSSNFEPYPGFKADSYKEYSEPVFGTRKVLRGGAWATRSRMLNSKYRNFFTPERRDVFGGFRTCAPHNWD